MIVESVTSLVRRLISTDLTALLDDGVPAAGEAELVSNVARALDKVRVLQLAVTICALELGPTARPVIAPIAGAGHLVTPGPGGRRPVLKIEVLINYFNLTKSHRVHVSPVPELNLSRMGGPSLEAGWGGPPAF